MNARERLFAVLNGECEKLDHVPVWMLFPYHPTGFYVDVRRNRNFSEVQKMVEKYAITLNRRNVTHSVFTNEVVTEYRTFDENGEKVNQRLVKFKGRTLVSEQRDGASGTRVKKLLDSAEDIEFFCSFPVNTDKAVLYSELDSWRLNYLKEKAEFPGHLGSMMLDIGEPVQILYPEANLEELSIASVMEDTNRIIVEFFGRLQEHFKLVYQYCVDHRLADVYFMVGSELAAPPMFSIETFRSWIMPFSSELISIAHSGGSKVIQHFHGQVKHLLPYFVEMGADALHTIEAPPIGNCTMREAFDVVGDKLVLIGNIQYDDFRSFSDEKMRKAVTELLDETRGKRFILSPSAGPFDDNPPAQFIKNYMTFIETAWNYEISCGRKTQ